MKGLLPDNFASLEPFAGYWPAETLSGRDARRIESSEAQRLAFYDAAAPLMAEAFAYLDSRSLAKFGERDWRLHWLMLSLVHVALAVEVQRDAEAVHARGARRMPIVHCHADRAWSTRQKA